MIIKRGLTSSTETNMKNVLEVLDHPTTEKVTLFASAQTIEGDGLIHEANLPLLFALAHISVPIIGSIYILFDGNFLTAQRGARYSEVKAVLDKAQDNSKAFFCPVRLDQFPHKMDPKDAVNYLLAVPSKRLDSNTRKEYFALLSNLSEDKQT